MERGEVIKILKYCNDIDGHICFARSELSDYEDQYYGLHGGSAFGSMSTKTNKISNPTEFTVLNIPAHISRRMELLRSEVERLASLKTAILAEIDKLPLVEKNIIDFFYFKGLQWVQISSRVHYSVTQCKKIRNRALEKLGGFFDQNGLVKNFNHQF